MQTVPTSYFLVTLLSKAKLKIMPKLGWSLPVSTGKVPYSCTDHTETSPWKMQTHLFPLKIGWNKGLLHSREMPRKSEHSVPPSSGLPANISISSQRLLQVWAARDEIPLSQQEKQQGYPGINLGLWAHLEPAHRAASPALLTALLSFLTCSTFLAGERWIKCWKQTATPYPLQHHSL